ncbi:MAG TPA: DUF72 domain-containing protein [Dehalococcoidia bacterium]|jgi:uncharacterized protein YecE (DUF72 family)
MAGELRIGTAGWTDPTLIKCKCFYPPEAKTAEERLRFYASQFDTVELDTSFYAIPPVDSAIGWARQTPDGFLFDVKAFRLFTQHQTPPKMLPAEVRDEATPLMNSKGNVYYEDLPEALVGELWQRFQDSLSPLKTAGKLGYVLLQFPDWVTKRHSNLRYIEKCAARLEGYDIAVEFRHRSWLGDDDRRETLAFLREQNLALVIVDEPQGFNSSVPPVWEATSPDLSVVRFHGRNTETWMKRGLKSAAERFDYLYSTSELREFVEPVQRLREQSRQVHAVFNNCMEDKAQRNAREFATMLVGLT